MSKIAIELEDGTTEVTEVLDDETHGYIVIIVEKQGDGIEVDLTANATGEMMLMAARGLKMRGEEALAEDAKDMFSEMPPQIREIAERLGVTPKDFERFMKGRYNI